MTVQPLTDRVAEAFKQLLSSKKVYTAVVGLVTLWLARRGVVLEPSDVTSVMVIFGALIGAQGAADFGKAGGLAPTTVLRQTVTTPDGVREAVDVHEGIKS